MFLPPHRNPGSAGTRPIEAKTNCFRPFCARKVRRICSNLPVYKLRHGAVEFVSFRSCTLLCGYLDLLSPSRKSWADIFIYLFWKSCSFIASCTERCVQKTESCTWEIVYILSCSQELWFWERINYFAIVAERPFEGVLQSVGPDHNSLHEPQNRPRPQVLSQRNSALRDRANRIVTANLELWSLRSKPCWLVAWNGVVQGSPSVWWSVCVNWWGSHKPQKRLPQLVTEPWRNVYVMSTRIASLKRRFLLRTDPRIQRKNQWHPDSQIGTLRNFLIWVIPLMPSKRVQREMKTTQRKVGCYFNAVYVRQKLLKWELKASILSSGPTHRHVSWISPPKSIPFLR